MTLLTHDSADEDWSNSVASAAAGRGHLHIFLWLIEQNPRFLEEKDAVYCAATTGHLHILQWLQQQPSLEVGGIVLVLATLVFVPDPRRPYLQMIDTFWSSDGINTFDQAAGMVVCTSCGGSGNRTRRGNGVYRPTSALQATDTCTSYSGSGSSILHAPGTRCYIR